MKDKSLLEDLEQFQELSEQESEEVSGGSTNLNTQYLKLGGCPGCRSGFDPEVIKYNQLLINPVQEVQEIQVSP